MLEQNPPPAAAGATTQRICAWCGPAVVVTCALGLAAFARFVPPPSASLSAADLASVFRGSSTTIRIGLMLVVFGAALFGPFIAVISAQMKRIEGERSPLAYAQLVLGACFIMEIIFPLMAVQTAAYRPERADPIQQALNDFGWLTFFGVASTAFVQMVIIGVVVLQDTRSDPVFPRWSGYFNMWVGLMYTPGTVVVFFRNGPLAWTGLFVFWLPFTAFFAWLFIMTYLLLTAVKHEVGESQAAARQTNDARDQLGRLAAELARVTSRLDMLDTRATRAEEPRLG